MGESMILKQLDHPNILKLYSIFEDSQSYYLVTEYNNIYEAILKEEIYCKDCKKDLWVRIKLDKSLSNFCKRFLTVITKILPIEISNLKTFFLSIRKVWIWSLLILGLLLNGWEIWGCSFSGRVKLNRLVV